MSENSNKTVEAGISMGSHGICSWFYVFYRVWEGNY